MCARLLTLYANALCVCVCVRLQVHECVCLFVSVSFCMYILHVIISRMDEEKLKQQVFLKRKSSIFKSLMH